MGLFDLIKTISNKKYADSSSIPDEERQYYRPDEYYTLSAFPNTPFEKKVVTFEERKRMSYPSRTGLYVAEILLLYYCSQGKYPNPSNGYPSFWWFEYGIRDVGGILRDLERRGYLNKNQSCPFSRCKFNIPLTIHYNRQLYQGDSPVCTRSIRKMSICSYRCL